MANKEYDLECPYCRQKAELHRDSSIVYGRDYGPIYLCSCYPICDSYVGCHPNSVTPLGRLANAELRYWKKEAHKYFDHLWKTLKILKLHPNPNGHSMSKSYIRGRAYKWLSKELDIPGDKTHIGMFDVKTCQKVVEICKPHYDE